MREGRERREAREVKEHAGQHASNTRPLGPRTQGGHREEGHGRSDPAALPFASLPNEAELGFGHDLDKQQQDQNEPQSHKTKIGIHMQLRCLS